MLTGHANPAESAALRVLDLRDQGDDRGRSFAISGELLAGLDGLEDLHVASVVPGAVRGNHYHAERNELIVVIHPGAWSLHWDDGEGTPIQMRMFSGAGAVAISVPPGCAHAVRNVGDGTLWLLAACDGRYDPARPDAHHRAVV